MGLLSIFKRKSDAGEPAAQAPASAMPDGVAAARIRARRRLIGATVLLGLGVIGFPLLFETQPRPIALNIPIEIPRKDGAPPLVVPAATRPMSPASAAVLGAGQLAEHAADGPAASTEITERSADQGRELAPPVAAVASVASPKTAAVAPRVRPESVHVAEPTQAVAKPPKPAASKTAPITPTPRPPATKPDDAARARALLDGKTEFARVVVQVGAYTDPQKLLDARHKVERLGLKTYTQVVTTDAGRRTRVRVGPFANRAEADKAAARIKAAGLPAAILAL